MSPADPGGSPIAYDEVGSRTRQAWLRTSMTVIGVTLLALRGLVLAGAQTWALLIALLPAVILLTTAVLRMRQVRHAESVHATSVITFWVFASAVGLVTVALLSVVI